VTDEKNRATRDTPPEGPEDHSYIWDTLKKAERSWRVTGPIVAIAENWKALAGVAVVVAWFNRPEILAAFQVILGGGK